MNKGLKKLNLNIIVFALAVILLLCSADNVVVSADSKALNKTGQKSEKRNDTDEENDVNSINSIRTGYIYTGDSRIRRLNLTMNMKGMKDTWVYAKSGLGYSWFVCDSLERIKTVMDKHPKIDRWIITSGWGVNDLWNIESYLKKYKEILNQDSNEIKLYLMSVNPVSGRKRARYTRIPYFNSRLKEFVQENEELGAYYIDTYSSLVRGGFSTIDGLHYTERTNRRIYDMIRKELDRTNAYINYSALDISVGAVRTLEVKDVYNRVRWTVSDRRVAAITEIKGDYGNKAVITAKKEGKCIVKAIFNNMVLSCNINVNDNKAITIYFSYSGNTQMVAEYMKDYVGGDLVSIEPAELYPVKESKLIKRVKKEFADNGRPAIDNKGVDLSKYDDIYLGFPIWYGKAPRVIYSYLDNCTGLGGQNVYCFATSDSGDSGDSITELQAVYTDASVNACINIISDDVLTSSSRKRIRKWIDGSDSD